MKVFGCILIFVSACSVFLTIHRKNTERIRLARALADDLALLRCGICIYRRSLEQILETDLGQGDAARFWNDLADLLRSHRGTVRDCWERAAESLPTPLRTVLLPLGALLPAGGETFDRAVNEARDALLVCVRTQEGEQSVKLRLTAAVCFSAAALIILVCI